MSTRKPRWWRWFEPPRWFPQWLHLVTCTYCRGMRAYGRKLRRETGITATARLP